MGATIQILVSLRNADPTALTAWTCLRRFLGFGENLLAVRRRVLWELVAPGDAETGGAIDTLRRSGELWNPNKEAARIRRSGEGIAELGEPYPNAPGWESYLAWDPERDLDRIPHAILPLRAEGWRLARGILWSLHWREPDPALRVHLSEQAVLCKGGKEGLLVHPHLEDYRRIEGDPPAPWLPGPVQEA